MPDASVDAVITDPPYGIDYNPKQYKRWNGETSPFEKLIGDESEFDPSPLLNFRNVVLWGANNFANKLPRGGWLCWDKRTNERADNMIGSPFELAWTNNQKTYKMLRLQHGGVINADSTTGNNQKRLHPTQKPIALMEWCIKLFTNEGDTILDPFMGSGTTGVACARLNRNFIGIEINPQYFEIAQRRIAEAQAQLTLNFAEATA